MEKFGLLQNKSDSSDNGCLSCNCLIISRNYLDNPCAQCEGSILGVVQKATLFYLD